MWEEISISGGNPLVRLGDQMTISYVDAGHWTQVAVRGKSITTGLNIHAINEVSQTGKIITDTTKIVD